MLDVALVPQEKLTSPQGKGLIPGQVAWLLDTTPERRKGPAERASGRKGCLDTWQMVQLALCPLAVLHQGLLPLVSQHTHWARLALALPRSPSCLGTSPGLSNSSCLPREHALGKTRPPPSKHIQLPRELLSSTSKLGRTDNKHYLETRNQGHSRAGLGWSKAFTWSSTGLSLRTGS